MSAHSRFYFLPTHQSISYQITPSLVYLIWERKSRLDSYEKMLIGQKYQDIGQLEFKTRWLCQEAEAAGGAIQAGEKVY